jgi:hypothetical protein
MTDDDLVSGPVLCILAAPDPYMLRLLPEWARSIQEAVSGYELTRTQVWPGRQAVCAQRIGSSAGQVYLVITDDEREMRAALGLPVQDNTSWPAGPRLRAVEPRIRKVKWNAH